MQKFKIRASASGKLMTKPQGGTNQEKYDNACSKLEGLEERYLSFKNKDCKSAVDIYENKIPAAEKEVKELWKTKNDPVFSETTKTYVNDWYKEQVYGVKKEFYSKYTEKGIVLEDKAIDKAIEWLNLPFTIKNDEYFENEYFTGTPDLILEDEVLDMKCSWDAYSFPLLDKELPNKDYFYQLQVYMHLTGKKKARVVYMLLNTPENISKYETKVNYDHVPVEKRFKEYRFEYDPTIIEQLEETVNAIREHLKTI